MLASARCQFGFLSPTHYTHALVSFLEGLCPSDMVGEVEKGDIHSGLDDERGSWSRGYYPIHAVFIYSAHKICSGLIKCPRIDTYRLLDALIRFFNLI